MTLLMYMTTQDARFVSPEKKLYLWIGKGSLGRSCSEDKFHNLILTLTKDDDYVKNKYASDNGNSYVDLSPARIGLL